VLVAFSGTLEDPDTGTEWTEAQLNGFPETRLPEMFGYVKADDPQAAARDLMIHCKPVVTASPACWHAGCERRRRPPRAPTSTDTSSSTATRS
jgi:hypothetical protein